MKSRAIVIGASFAILALAAPYSLVGLGDLSPVGDAAAHQCQSTVDPVNDYVCCPFNSHHAADPVAHVRDCL